MRFWPKDPEPRQIRLPREEFEILSNDEDSSVVLDKVAGVRYTLTKRGPNAGWKFPAGSRSEWIARLTGMEELKVL